MPGFTSLPEYQRIMKEDKIKKSKRRVSMWPFKRVTSRRLTRPILPDRKEHTYSVQTPKCDTLVEGNHYRLSETCLHVEYVTLINGNYYVEPRGTWRDGEWLSIYRFIDYDLCSLWYV